MNAKGVYYGLVEAQNLRVKDDDSKEIEDDQATGMMPWSHCRDCSILKIVRFIISTLILDIPDFYRVRSLSEHQSHGNEVSIDGKDEITKKTDEEPEVWLDRFMIE